MEKELEEKLKGFSFLVMEDAEKKRDNLVHQIEEQTKERLDSKETEYLTSAYQKIQKNLNKIRKEDNERVLHVEVEAKRSLLLKREQIINEVFDQVKEKLDAYIQSAAYETWLTDLAKKAAAEVGEGSKVLYVTEHDLKFKDKILGAVDQTAGTVAVEAVNDIDFLGGIKVYNQDRRIAVDYSFKEMLEQQKGAFLQTSGLVID